MSDLKNILSHSDCLSKEQLMAYLDNSLDKPTVHEIESHITDCMFCSDALEGLQLLPIEESTQHLADIKSGMDKLLLEDEPATENIVAAEEKAIPELTAKKGGKRITLAAAAGLFLLIFASGLVVFSYINNNTNWLNNNQSEYVKGGEDKKNAPIEEIKTNSRELEETFTLDEADLNKEEAEAISKNSNDKNLEAPRNKNRLTDVNLKPATTKTREDALARNSKYQEPTPPALPKVSSAPKREELAANEKIKGKEIIANADVEESKELDQARRAGTQNTYSQPRYDGKMKDLNDAPAVTKNSASKKLNTTSGISKLEKKAIGKSSADEIRSQSTDYIRQKKGADKADNYSLGVYAFNQAKYKESIKFLKRALRQKDLKNRDEANYYLALAYEKTNDFAKARKIYTELEKSDSYKKRAQSRMREMPVK